MPATPSPQNSSACLEPLTRLAARLFDVSMVAIVLRDHAGLCVAASVGMDAAAQARALALCADTRWPDSAILLDDGAHAADISSHPAITQAPRWQFHAAVALTAADGNRLGMLCLFAHAPRRVTRADRSLLDDLAALAVRELASAAQADLLEQAQRQHAASQRRHKTFTLASHELRTPLASIIGFSELLMKRAFEPATAHELLEIVHTQASLMANVIHQVFDLARIEAGGRAALRLAPTTLDSVVQQALDKVAPLGQNGRIAVTLAPDLPLLVADAQRLALALASVLNNSIQYSAAATPIALSAWHAHDGLEDALLVCIRDHGIGMTPEQQAHLFEAFYRGGNFPDHGGTGLGMCIFKEIMDLHSASVDVASAPGSGTSVTLRLPRTVSAGGAHG